MWGSLNTRKTTPGTPSQYAQGAIKGNWDPSGPNRFRVRVKGTQYNGGYYYNDALLLASGVSVNGPITDWLSMAPGVTIYFGYFPTVDRSSSGQIGYFGNPGNINMRGGVNDGMFLGAVGLQGFSEDTAVSIEVEPLSGAGVPYPATTPGTPTVSDPAVLFPKVPPLQSLQNAKTTAATAAKVLPLSPVKAKPVPTTTPKPATAEPVAQPNEPSDGITRTTTITTGPATLFKPQAVPRIAPLPARSLPGLLPGTTPAGKPVQAPAPLVKTTPQDARQYGTRTITAGAPATSPQAVANEIGRIEQKLGLMLPLLSGAPSWLDDLAGAIKDDLLAKLEELLAGGDGGDPAADLPAVSYAFSPPYDTPGSGLAEEATYDIPAAPIGPAVVDRLDAIAEALQMMAAWRVKLSKGNAPKPNVTLTSYGQPDE
jgi:hypothetical protein